SRPAEGRRSLAIAWCMAVPSFVLAFLSILWPARLLLPEDCLGTCGPRGSAVPPFLLRGAILLVAAVVLALALRRAVYVWPAPAWRLVAAVGLALTAGALIVELMTRSLGAAERFVV